MLTAGYEYQRMSDDLISLHLEHLRAGGQSPRTIEARYYVLNRLANHLPFGLAFAATEQVEEWLASLRRIGRARATLSIYHYHITAFYRWACRAHQLEGDPTLTIGRPRKPLCVPKPVTEEEINRALELPEPLRTAIILAGWAGLRASEIAACCRQHITEEILSVPDGKGGDPGTVPTHPMIWEHVKDRPPGPLITDRDGNTVSGHWLSIHIRRGLDQLGGLEEVHLHRLRHRYRTLIQATTGDLRVTQECLRHKNVSATQVYTMVTNKRLAAAVRALPAPAVGHEPVDSGLVPPATEAA